MEQSIIIAGFGGQGVLFAGQLLAHAALEADKHVTWFPSYGPEMRGGTAHCTVVISDEPIGSPLVRHPNIVIAMNLPSVEKYRARVAAGGLFLINSSLVEQPGKRAEIHTLLIPANQIAQHHGSEKVATVVMLGALLAVQPILPVATLKNAIERRLPKRHHHLLATNLAALEGGFDCVAGELAVTNN
jgi:2-oxoglutarate ferredoxin oxidoreductase subunit gamma